MQSDIHLRILRTLAKEPLEAYEIANRVGESTKRVVVYLNDLLRLGYLIGDADFNPMGYYGLSLPGKIAASSPVAIDFETICARLGEAKWIPKGIHLSMSADETISGRAIEFKCGCAAFRIAPPSAEPGMRFLPCSEDHEQIVEQYGATS